MHLVVGLGNPGIEYAKTRHNVGACFVHALAEKLGANFKKSLKHQANIALCSFQNQPLKLVIPTVFMNHSGFAVQSLVHYYRIPLDRVWIVHDELDFFSGIVRVKYAGGAGGHKGVSHIIQQLGGKKDFWRLRLGIGHPGHRDKVAAYVLNCAKKIEQQAIDKAIFYALDQLDELLAYPKNVDQLMQLFGKSCISSSKKMDG